MQTKEEILYKNNLRDFKELGEKVNNRITTYSATYASMEEYAKQECIEFANYIGVNNYREISPDEWENDAFIDLVLSTEEVYELYRLQSKK